MRMASVTPFFVFTALVPETLNFGRIMALAPTLAALFRNCSISSASLGGLDNMNHPLVALTSILATRSYDTFSSCDSLRRTCTLSAGTGLYLMAGLSNVTPLGVEVFEGFDDDIVVDVAHDVRTEKAMTSRNRIRLLSRKRRLCKL